MNKDIINQDREIPVTFKPRARLLLQLGDQLIKNESIALIELVKNSYDADANTVDIYMENVDEALEGTIIIEDDGYGMDLETVEKVWMEPGSDFKSEKFAKREASPKYNRLPIGEKGIGRFGVHKLGNQIEMTTKKDGHREVSVKIDWDIFNNFRYLEEVPVTITEREKPLKFKNGKTGTNIVISQLRKEWTRGVARNVRRTITSLVSPFATNDSFNASFNIIDKPNWFDGLLEWGDVKHFALFNFKVIIRESKIIDFEYSFMPWASMPNLHTRHININDPLIQQYLRVENEDGIPLPLNNYNIGDVVFEGFIFDRDSYLLRLGVSDKTGFKKYLDSNCGVRVFRDGLRVYDYGEPENDWLDMNLRRVNQPTKKLSKNIILGAVYLDRNKSTGLIEKTNREGFVENEEYYLFKNYIIHALNIIEILRYSDKSKMREFYGPTPKSEPVLSILGDLRDYVEKNVSEDFVKKEIIRSLVKIEDDYKRINENLLKAAGAGLSLSVVIHEVEKIISEVIKVLKVESASERVLKLVQHLSTLIDGYSEIIKKSTQTNEDLKNIIEQSLFNTEYRLQSHKIEVVKAYKTYQGKARTKVARSLLISSLMNIIDNSIFWLEKSGVHNKRIYVDIIEGEMNVNIIIADNGVGFLLPTDEIIEPFVSAKPGGMGLGLHITNEIMLAHDGKLNFPDWGDFEIPVDFKNGAILSLTFKK